MLINNSIVEQITLKYSHLEPFLNERSRRLWAATEASVLGYGGILAVHRATGLSQNTIRSGLKQRKAISIQIVTANLNTLTDKSKPLASKIAQ